MYEKKRNKNVARLGSINDHLDDLSDLREHVLHHSDAFSKYIYWNYATILKQRSTHRILMKKKNFKFSLT